MISLVRSAMAAAVLSVALAPIPAASKQSTSINVPEDKERFASLGDVLVKVTLRESLPNALGGSDIFGRKRDRGFVEIQYMGLAGDGRAVFRRRAVDIYSNETTMTRSAPRAGTATVTTTGNTARITSYSSGADRATIQALPPDTLEFALDLAKNNVITIEDRQIDILAAEDGGVRFKVTKRD